MELSERTARFRDLLSQHGISVTEEDLQDIADIYEQGWHVLYFEQHFTPAMLTTLPDMALPFQEKSLELLQERQQKIRAFLRQMYVARGFGINASANQYFHTLADLNRAKSEGTLVSIKGGEWLRNDDFWVRPEFAAKIEALVQATDTAGLSHIWKMTSSSRFTGQQLAYFHWGWPALMPDIAASGHTAGWCLDIAVENEMYRQMLVDVDSGLLAQYGGTVSLDNLPTIEGMLKFGIFAGTDFERAWHSLLENADRLGIKVFDESGMFSMKVAEGSWSHPNPVIHLEMIL